MKRISIISALMALIIGLLGVTACSEKDEWDGEKVEDYGLCETMQAESGIACAPTVVCDLSTKAAYERLTESSIKPASVIVRLNDKYNVVDEKGERICSFSSLYSETLKGRIIPIIYISDEAGVQRTISLFSERYDLLDASVMSDNAAYVKALREEFPQLRGIVEFKQLKDVYDAVRISNSNLASIVTLPQSIATAENVFYLQSRFRTVWVRPESDKKLSLYESINSGAYGIVTSNYESAVNALKEYGENSLTRMPFVVAHRGLPNGYNENSVSGTRAAIAAGATHLELDGYLTRDGRIALMHDYTIDRTSDGEGVIEDYKSDELSEFKLDLCEPKESIPMLDDIFEEMKGTDVVLLFEIKSQKTEIVNALKRALEAHDMARQVVVITFNTRILETMTRVLPEIPTASLSDVAENAMDDAMLIFGTLNTSMTSPYTNVTPEINGILRDRGIMGWYWTYDTVADMNAAVRKGYTGLTTNVADEFVSSEGNKYVYVKGAALAGVPVVGGETELTGVTYGGAEEQITGKVIYTEDVGGKYAVIASYVTSSGQTLYTQTYYVSK